MDVDPSLESETPPDKVYHGSARWNLDCIFNHGLNPGERQQVHPSPDPKTAEKVGRRHGGPVVLRIDTGGVHGMVI